MLILRIRSLIISQSHLWVPVLLEQSNINKESPILFVNYGAFISCQTHKIMHFTEPLSEKMQYNFPIMSASAWMKKTTDVDGTWTLLKRLMRRQMCCFDVGSSPAETATVDGSITRLRSQKSHFNLTAPLRIVSVTVFPLSESNSI